MMDDLRTIKPDKNNRLTPEDLAWIGASEHDITCTDCGKGDLPLYTYWDWEYEPYCAKCLIDGWEASVPESEEDADARPPK